MNFRFRLLASSFLIAAASARASSLAPMPVEQELDHAAGAFRALVVSNQSSKDTNGRIYTATVVQVTERLKGKFPRSLQLVHRGGQVGSDGETDDLSPQFEVGKEYLIVVGRRADGTLYALRGTVSAKVLQRTGTGDLAPEARTLIERVRAHTGKKSTDVKSQSASLMAAAAPPRVSTGASYVSGLLVDANNISARFLQADRGEPVPYLIDMQSLPAGVTPQQALTAVQNALAAWSAVTSLTFVYQGTANFGVAAPNVGANDGKIRIQLHDNYNYITSGLGILGQGGRSYTTGGHSTGGAGANVSGNEFHRSLSGYLVLKHTEPSLQNLQTLEEVLCHEIGHVLSMAHSSVSSPEPNATLYQSIMYYQVHADGRGALLGAYDPPIIAQVHPAGDTPPFAYDRYLDVVTATPDQPNVAGVNEIQSPGYDLQTASSSLGRTIISQTSSYGSFSFVGTSMKYACFLFGDADRLDPASGAYYELAVLRINDGVNVSPFINVRVVSFASDSFPTISDGIPDSWMQTYFGDADPDAGPNRSAVADYDGDGKTNLQEFISGTSPTDGNSVLKITSVSPTTLQWNARAYELYEVQSSTNLSAWTRLINQQPVAGVGLISLSPDASARKFYRVQRVP